MSNLERLQATAKRWIDVDEHVAQPYWAMKQNHSNDKAIAEFLNIASKFYSVDEIRRAIEARRIWEEIEE